MFSAMSYTDTVWFSTILVTITVSEHISKIMKQPNQL